MTQITMALTKGRILTETLPLLKLAGIKPLEDIAGSRKLVFGTNIGWLRVLVLRGADVPTYVQFGVADLGVSGKDILLERDSTSYYEPLDLGIARCRLMTAVLKDAKPSRGRIIVATKYTNVARKFYAERGRQAELIKLYGAMELAPLLNLADEIVDIVDTGKTLKANGLVAVEHVADVTSRLIVNKAAMKTKCTQIQEIIDRLRGVI